MSAKTNRKTKGVIATTITPFSDPSQSPSLRITPTAASPPLKNRRCRGAPEKSKCLADRRKTLYSFRLNSTGGTE
ncbi:MAG TPA: hypothetical protein VM008_03560 [Phycisphaerae bacterium]|nr:hypothetical protein [Phycisphaerae bacterium]